MELIKKSNKSIIGLILGVFSILSVVLNQSGPASFSRPLFPLFMFGFLATIGLIFSILGFRYHKILSIVAIILCIIALIPTLVLASLFLV